MVEKFLRCRQCNQLIPRYGSFGDFGETSSLPGVEWSSDDLEDQQAFFRAHQDHTLEELTIDRETLVSDRYGQQPASEAYVEATNGREVFLIRRRKEGFDRPAVYDLLPGRIKVSSVSLEIQEDEVRKQISWMNGSFPLPVQKVDKFMEAFQEELKTVHPDRWQEEMETTLPGENSLLAYGAFRQFHWERVLQRCREDFHQSEMRLIEGFIRDNRRPDDVLGLQVKKTISVSFQGEKASP